MRPRRLVSLALALAGLWLVAFHAAIFWQRISDASILQSGVLGRWIASAFLIAALAAFRRHLRGRRAQLVFWVLVAFLHLTIPADERILTPADNAVLLQLAMAVLVVAAGWLAVPAPARHALARLDLLSLHQRSTNGASPQSARPPPSF